LKQGKSFEALIKHIEKALANKDFVTVKSPKKSIDRIMGNPREYDVFFLNLIKLYS
jgi:hypothetical protein